ncbi:uncharacterized protein LOC119172717 [Rhipicephalus microplus]|uniref:uncharacterized protein LOC119172717 n=1 Tax=Rhipicephalus microplus TaxID=6941 RepID=UPI003F6BABD9
MKSKKKFASRKEDQGTTAKAGNRREQKDVAALLHYTPSTRTRASRKAQDPSSTGAKVTPKPTPTPLEARGMEQPPLQVQVYPTPLFGQMPVHHKHLMPSPQQQSPTAYMAVGDLLSVGSEACISTSGEAETVLVLPRPGVLPNKASPLYGKQVGEVAVPCSYPALVVRGRPKAALRYSEPSYDATDTTTNTINSDWSAHHRVILDARNIRPRTITSPHLTFRRT